MFGMGVHPHDAGHLQHMMHTQYQHSYKGGGPGQDGQKTPMTPGQISYMRNMQQDTTPKYIKSLRSELNVALKKNLELSHKLEQKEDELESDIQN